ncbi:MAG: hypothetical protein ACI9F9_003212, partial [Candidatus Paceibacteria bacterium]
FRPAALYHGIHFLIGRLLMLQGALAGTRESTEDQAKDEGGSLQG